MSIDNIVASVAVKDLDSALTWYKNVLGRPPDSTPMPEVVEWKFERGGWLWALTAALGPRKISMRSRVSTSECR